MASWVRVCLVLLLVGGACGAASEQSEPRSDSSRTPDAVVSATVTDEAFDPANFSRPTVIDNKWFPLRPGTQFVYEGGVTDEGERLSHRVVFTVTDLTKVVGGVRSIVLWDRDYTDGELVEGELAFHAQDDAGNVWNMGEYPEEYEDGEFAGAPDTWLAGLAGARPGILMRAEVRTGTPSYLQGFAPKIEFADRARVFEVGATTCVPIDNSKCYKHVLITDEWNPDEPGAHQRKFYAPGVGNVRVGWAGAREKEKESLRLTRIVHLGHEALARVRQQALELEKRAYKLPLYRHTQRAAR